MILPHRMLMALLAAFLFSATLTHAQWKPETLIASARAQIGVTVSYDAAYRVLDYPGGDVPKETGVCTDVIVRALREQGIDLQKDMHEDMKKAFSAYPKRWGLKTTDRNIDHRRVPNMMTYFRRQGWSVPISKKPEDYASGDLVTWDLVPGTLPHIGIVSDRKSPAGVPLIIHNIGRGTQEEDILFTYTITGHYRSK
jgi:uncharacterized protein